MALSSADQAVLDRLNGYNGNAYNATTNPRGFARGGNQQGVFVAALKDVASAAVLSGAAAGGASDNAAATAADRVKTGQDRAAAAQSKEDAATSATNAANALDAFEDRFLKPKASDPTTDDDGNPLLVGAMYFNTTEALVKVWSGASWGAFTPSAAAYYTKGQVDALFGNISPMLPITMTAPAANAINVGQGGTYTFVARAFVGDTTGFYSNYGIPVVSRFVNVYEPGGTVPVKVFSATGGGPSLAVNFTGSGLFVSHVYQFEFGYTDAQGNTAKSPKVSATTGAQFKAPIGTSYEGGFLAFENFGDGGLFDLVVAPKSTEASKVWPSQAALVPSPSRVNGLSNTALVSNSTAFAQGYALSIVIGGTAGYLGAIDELRAIASKLTPNVATQLAFQAGGAEVFSNSTSWSSTEFVASDAFTANLGVGTTSNSSKTSSLLVRAIKRVAVTPPFAIGTAMEGGYLAAYFTDLSSGSPVTYMLIVADKATEVTRAWSPNTGTAGTAFASRTNGVLSGTYTGSGNAAGSPAFYYVSELVSGGQTDWYLGAIDEMLAIARTDASMPSAQRLTNQNNYWTSTEVSSAQAKVAYPNTGAVSEVDTAKSNIYSVRPIRRVAI